ASGWNGSLWGPPAHWQARLPGLGRTVHATTLGGCADLTPVQRIDGPVFAKVADIKLESIPAQRWDDLAQFTAACSEVGLAEDTPVLVTQTLLDLVREDR